jgi:hypothetical protein
MEICHCWRLKRAAHHLNEFYDKALAPSPSVSMGCSGKSTSMEAAASWI